MRGSCWGISSNFVVSGCFLLAGLPLALPQVSVPKTVRKRIERRVRTAVTSVGFLRVMGVGAVVEACGVLIMLVASGMVQWLTLSSGDSSSTVGLWWRCSSLGDVDVCTSVSHGAVHASDWASVVATRVLTIGAIVAGTGAASFASIIRACGDGIAVATYWLPTLVCAVVTTVCGIASTGVFLSMDRQPGTDPTGPSYSIGSAVGVNILSWLVSLGGLGCIGAALFCLDTGRQLVDEEDGGGEAPAGSAPR